MTDLIRARHILHDGATYALVRENEEIFGTERGISPLLALIDKSRDVRGFSAADKIVGKAAALLYVYMGVAAVYAEVLSQSAADVFVAHRLYNQSPRRRGVPHGKSRGGLRRPRSGSYFVACKTGRNALNGYLCATIDFIMFNTFVYFSRFKRTQ